MKEGKLYFLKNPDPNRPVELKYLAEFDNSQKWFEEQEDALIYLFDNGVKEYIYLTKGLDKYNSVNNQNSFELWHLENRVGYVTYGHKLYYDENNELKKKRSYIWRFIGHGRSCFADTKEELKDKVLSLIHYYKEDTEGRGYNTYPYYTKYYRKEGVFALKNFIAFDFETANSRRNSICSVGMVFVKEGKIVDSIYQLINPEEEFDEFNTAIHHITPYDVKNSPTFDMFYNSIRNKIDNQLMIAHYLAFDGYALKENLKKYEILACNNQLLCTYQLSKRLLTGKSSYSLDALCHHYGIKITQHHHALSDAQACAELMLKLVDEHELLDLDSIFNKTRIRPGTLSPYEYQSSLVSKNKKKIDLPEIEISEDADSESPFYGKNIVFTGKLNLFTRREAAELVAIKGGRPQNGINKETNYIILGDFEDVMIKGNKSSKLEKAEKMISEGKKLEIISEADFIKMI